MTMAYVSVASNVEPEAHITSGLRQLHHEAPVRAASRFYRTPALGPGGQPTDGPAFVNGVVRVETERQPHRLRDLLRRIEVREGRLRGADRYAPRPLDLDILLYGQITLQSPDLVLPDPDVLKRPFLARCLLEIDSGLRLPDGTPIPAPAGPAPEPVPGLGLQVLGARS
jgi:2-amino-4-hydroxy-6-hydroxymethyldihydropteridine diphosphokinase